MTGLQMTGLQMRGRAAAAADLPRTDTYISADCQQMREKLIVIAGDGDFPSKGPALSALKRGAGGNSVLIACDGAADILERHGFMPDHIVGDMDSLSESAAKRLAGRIHKVDEQESNDQTKSFRFALGLIEKNLLIEKTPGRPYRICFVGTTGKREDHTIGNVSLLADYAEEAAAAEKRHPGLSIEICSITEYGIFRPVLGTTELNGRVGDRISIFAFDNTLQIKSEGLEYKTDSVKFDLWWKATLNKFSAARIRLDFSHPAKALLFFPF